MVMMTKALTVYVGDSGCSLACIWHLLELVHLHWLGNTCLGYCHVGRENAELGLHEGGERQ